MSDAAGGGASGPLPDIAGYAGLVEIGRDRSGVAYRAERVAGTRPVVIRVLSAELSGARPEWLDGSGARLGLTLAHAAIAAVLAVGALPGGERYVVTEHLAGGGLAERMERDGPLDWLPAVRLAAQLAAGLAEAHRQGVVHGVLGIACVHFDGDGAPKLTDFGLWPEPAAAGGVGDGWPWPDSTAPEVREGAAPTAAADVYGLGSLLFTMLSGRAPHRPLVEEPLTDVVGRALAEPWPALGGAVPGPLRRLVAETGARTPAGRPTMAEVEARLRDIADPTGSADQTSRPRPDDAPLPVDAPAPTVPSDAPRPTVPAPAMPQPNGSSSPMRSPPAPSAPPVPDASPGSFAPPAAPAPPSIALPPVVLDDDVQFTLYRPNRVAPTTWFPLLAFAHRSSLVERPDGTVFDPVEAVARQAGALLASEEGRFVSVSADSTGSIPRRGELVFEPWLEEGDVNPSRASFAWEEPVHRVEFRARVPASAEGRSVRGGLRVFLGLVAVGEVRFRIGVSGSGPAATEAWQPTPVQRFRRIFASYSHDDVAVVEAVADHVALTGDRYLIDVRSLRSGERWQARLYELIDDADVFQLFWSSNALRSAFVRREWEHALALRRDGFIRPVYWEDPLPRDQALGLPPEALLELHWSRLSPAATVHAPAVPHMPSPAIQMPSLPPSPPSLPAPRAGPPPDGGQRSAAAPSRGRSPVLPIAALAAAVVLVVLVVLLLVR